MTLYDLPDIQYIPVNPEEIKNSIITVYEAISGKKLYPGDPVRLFLLAQADIIIQQRVLINDAAKMNLLRYARGDYLDHLGAFVETPRLQKGAAVAMVRFTLSAPRPETTLIAAGVRATAGNNLYFATSAVTEIPAGQLSADVLCRCEEPGTIGNGLLPGQINILVDPLPFVRSVANLTESAGGTDVELDDAYRERIYTSPERFSVAGPSGAYEYWARTANPGISDVRVFSPAPVEVEVCVLMAGGELPTQDILDAVALAVNDRAVRPLSDKVTVTAPNVVNYAIDLEYWIDASNAADAISIQTAVRGAVQDYVLWQKTRIGRDINPSELTRRVMNAGARRVSIAAPAFTELGSTEIAIILDPDADIEIRYGGAERD